jgi:hypothetical protein
MPTAGIRALTKIVSEITMDGSRLDGVVHLDVQGFVQEILETGFSDDSTIANSFLEIFELLKENRFEIVADVDCDDIL